MTKNQQENAENDASREDLASRVITALPEWITQLIQINGLIADRMGVVATDFHCLHALHQDGPATSSVLARRVGLTPGAASRMIDRLTEAGCVKRVPDPNDRRRVVIEPTMEGLDRITAYYAGLTARTRDDLTPFDDDQLRTLLRFVEVARDSAAAEVDRLRSAHPDG
ncbi:MarR family transcriptional regulator [Embleya scabrispora]|uniref:MarR family transcriptional regulator n=1 Tax=Embleya scabrispora TaxID=159449 RepID=A0A1T3NW16_9ACTN|nr:MarR family transcriptional regulator [Embleya scabrispora]OPC81026.1 MarR family transcriptional regulator [Embleya scabrispora]